MTAQQMLLGAGSEKTGQQQWTDGGTYNWTAPAGVTTIAILVVGAGGGTTNPTASGASVNNNPSAPVGETE